MTCRETQACQPPKAVATSQHRYRSARWPVANSEPVSLTCKSPVPREAWRDSRESADQRRAYQHVLHGSLKVHFGFHRVWQRGACRYKRITKLSIAALAVIAVVALLSPKGQRRIDTLKLKLRGELPEYSWLAVLVAQIPKVLRSNYSDEITGGLVSGVVRYSHRDPSGPCPVVFDTPFGEIHSRIVDDDLLEFLFREQVDRNIYSFEGASVAEGDIVVDGGAHLGTFTLNALRKGASKVIAFEPEPTNADCLRTTFSPRD